MDYLLSAIYTYVLPLPLLLPLPFIDFFKFVGGLCSFSISAVLAFEVRPSFKNPRRDLGPCTLVLPIEEMELELSFLLVLI